MDKKLAYLVEPRPGCPSRLFQSTQLDLRSRVPAYGVRSRLLSLSQLAPPRLSGACGFSQRGAQLLSLATKVPTLRKGLCMLTLQLAELRPIRFR